MIQLAKKEQPEMMSLKGQSHYTTKLVLSHKPLVTAMYIYMGGKNSWSKIKHEELVEKCVRCDLGQKASEIIKGLLTVSSSAVFHNDLTPHYSKVSNTDLSSWHFVVIVRLKASSQMMHIHVSALFHREVASR